MPVEVTLEPFQFPNFLKVRGWTDHQYPVSMLTPEQAAEYWDNLKAEWLKHVARKVQRREADMAAASRAELGKSGG